MTTLSIGRHGWQQTLQFPATIEFFKHATVADMPFTQKNLRDDRNTTRSLDHFLQPFSIRSDIDLLEGDSFAGKHSFADLQYGQ